MLERRIQYLEDDIESRKPTGRKAVKISPNQTFATIEEIWKAKEKAERQAAAYVARHGNTAAEDAEEIEKAEFKALCGMFQLE